jgi:hypothetical protein
MTSFSFIVVLSFPGDMARIVCISVSWPVRANIAAVPRVSDFCLRNLIMKAHAVSLNLLEPALLTSSGLGVPIVFGKTKIVVQMQLLTVSQKHEHTVSVLVPGKILTGLTDPNLRVLNLHEKPSAFTEIAPISVMVSPVVKRMALLTKTSMHVVMVKPMPVPTAHVITIRSASVFTSVVGISPGLILFVFALAVVELSLGHGPRFGLGSIIVVILNTIINDFCVSGVVHSVFPTQTDDLDVFFGRLIGPYLPGISAGP